MAAMTKREQAEAIARYCRVHPGRVLHFWHGTDRGGAEAIRAMGTIIGGRDGFPPGVCARASEAHGYAIRKGGARGAVVLAIDVACADVNRLGIKAEVGGSNRNEFLIGQRRDRLPVRVVGVRDYAGDRPVTRRVGDG